MQKIDLIRNFEITITDDNDNAPDFATNSEKPLCEDAQIGSVVNIATASDNDAGENSHITYSIVDGGESPFEIDPFSGEVRMVFIAQLICVEEVYRVPCHKQSAVYCSIDKVDEDCGL